MPKVDVHLLEEALKRITFPDYEGQNLMQMGIVSGLTCDEEGKVTCVLEVPPLQHHAFTGTQKAAEQVLKGVKGVREVMVVMTGSVKKTSQGGFIRSPKELKEKINLGNVKHVIAVASGKGGVGKSTVAVNVALTLKAKGYGVGLLDADVHGPSLPTMMGLSQKPASLDGKTIEPSLAHGVKCMSLGLMAPSDETPLAWRGPMLQSAVFQMLRDVNWASPEDPLDFLLMDLPPGTGDIMLTTCQSAPLSGAIIVTTPQDLALVDARRAHRLFHKLGIPLLGLVENMSYFACPHCAATTHIFGSHQGCQQESLRFGLPLLGSLPLTLPLREAGDGGTPLTQATMDTALWEALSTLCDNLLHQLASRAEEIAQPDFLRASSSTKSQI